MEMNWLENNYFKVIYLVILLSLPIAISLISLKTLNNLPSVCLYKRFFGLECWGCGMTRAIISVVNGNFKDAIEYNWRVLIVFPLLLYIYFLNIYKVYKKIKKLNQAS